MRTFAANVTFHDPEGTVTGHEALEGKIEALYAGAPPDWAFLAAALAARWQTWAGKRGRSAHWPARRWPHLRAHSHPVAQRILAMTAAIWHNKTGRPVTRSLIAYDH
jgi:hypothetical protein